MAVQCAWLCRVVNVSPASSGSITWNCARNLGQTLRSKLRWAGCPRRDPRIADDALDSAIPHCALSHRHTIYKPVPLALLDWLPDPLLWPIGEAVERARLHTGITHRARFFVASRVRLSAATPLQS